MRITLNSRNRPSLVTKKLPLRWAPIAGGEDISHTTVARLAEERDKERHEGYEHQPFSFN